MHGSECPFCGSGDTVKRGEGRRLCKSCRRSFRPSTSTVMSSMKLDRERFRKMANLMLNDVKLEAIIDSVGISSRTAYVWRMKVFAAPFEMQKSAMLSEKCWIDEVCKSTTRDAHPKLQPVNSLIAELKHFLRCHTGIRTEYLGIYAAWVAFKASVREGKIEERIALLESYCFQTKATFRVKDRYGRKK